MKRVWKWLAWIVGLPAVGFVLLVAAAAWAAHQRQAFASLPPGERQLAIFDAFAHLVESNYYDREFVEHEWPALRDHWRVEAEKSRNDFDVYFAVLLQMNQQLPSSHLSAVPPAPSTAPRGAGESSRQLPGTGGFDVATIRRARSTIGVVDHVDTGTVAAAAGIEPGWRVLSFKGCLAGQETTGVFLTALSSAQRLDIEAGKTVTFNDAAIETQADFDAKYRRSVTYACSAYIEHAPFEVRALEGVTYLRFDSFMEPDVIDQVLSAIEGAGERGLILDLRHNHGGFRDEMLRLMNRLLPAGSLVGREIVQGSETAYRADGKTV
ncbi:MAG TPA: S41 family peptidase, partial [Steroidobacteraceae bacterium]